MAREKLTLLSDDFTITKEMVETNQINEDFSDLQVINRLFRYYTFEEELTLEESVEKIEQFLEDNEKEVSDGYVKELCENYMRKEKTFKPLRKLESIQLYDSDVTLIKSLPNQNTRKAYFVMMMENKIRRTLEVKEPDTMYYDFYQYTGYLDTRLTRTQAHEVLKYLQQHNLIDVPLFELNKMYYVYQPESGRELYTVDPTKLDGKNLLQQFYDIFGKGLVIEDVMVIDLMQPVGHVIKKGKSEVQEYLKENGSKKDYSAITKVVNHEKYLLGDFTAVVVKNVDDKKYLLEVELLQRSMQPYTKKLFTTIPQMYTYYLFELLEYGSLNVLCDIPWQEIIKTRQKQVKQWKKEGFTDVTKEMLEVLKEEQGE